MLAEKYDYAHLNDQVTQAELDFTAPEIHGIACGMICGGVVDLHKHWKDILYSGLDAKSPAVISVQKALLAVLENTEAQIIKQEMNLTLLLPDDEADTTSKAIAIRDWCQGFLYGFGLAGPQTKELFSDDAGEALQDFTDISNLQLDSLDDEDIDDALAELEEFLWVAALLIHQDVIGKRPSGHAYDH